MTRSFRSPIDRLNQTIPVRVECYAGHQTDEQPVRFSLFDMNFEVRQIIDRWYQTDTRPEFPPARYFKVQTPDGKHFMLKHVIDEDRWYLWIKGEAVHL